MTVATECIPSGHKVKLIEPVTTTPNGDETTKALSAHWVVEEHQHKATKIAIVAVHDLKPVRSSLWNAWGKEDIEYVRRLCEERDSNERRLLEGRDSKEEEDGIPALLSGNVRGEGDAAGEGEGAILWILSY